MRELWAIRKATSYAKKKVREWLEDLVCDLNTRYGDEFRVVDIHKDMQMEFAYIEESMHEKYKLPFDFHVDKLLEDLFFAALLEESCIAVPDDFFNKGYIYWNLSIDVLLDSYLIDDYIKKLLYGILKKDVKVRLDNKLDRFAINCIEENCSIKVSFSKYRHRKIHALIALNGYTYKDVARRLKSLAEYMGLKMKVIDIIPEGENAKLDVSFTMH